MEGERFLRDRLYTRHSVYGNVWSSFEKIFDGEDSGEGGGEEAHSSRKSRRIASRAVEER